MSTLKKLLALTLALAMVLSVSVFAGNYSNDTYADAADIDEACKDAVELMYALDIMVGDGTNFKPEQAISRKEMAKIIYVLMNKGTDDKAANYVGNSIFADVPASEWYNGYVNYCAMTKKIQGYNGKFDPNGTLTVAAAAKMLLTAIGYDAEAYGFVGPNWENNVLTVAHEAGLLTDVATNLTGAAPRQWVALMIKNALGAYCYETIAAIPGNGVLGNYWVNSGNQLNNITTFGKKYLNVDIVKGIVTSVPGATLNGTTGTYVGGIKMADADLGIDDLGQQFSVVYKIKAVDNNGKVTEGTALSVRNTGKSVVAETLVKDITAKLTYATVDNIDDNSYAFTVGDLTAKLDLDDTATSKKIPVLDVRYTGDTLVAEGMTDNDLENFVGTVTNDVVRAIDKDADGDIDYVIYTIVSYAEITKAATSTKYGEYVQAKMSDGTKLTFNGNSNLYVEDLIICEDELVKGNLVKFVWNVDEGKFDVELLYGEKKAEFESRKKSKNQYTIEGETYGIADNAWEQAAQTLYTENNLGEKLDVVYDGDLIVYAETSNTNYTDMAEINEQLAVLLEADINNNGISNVRQVRLLTIDGEQEVWYDYDYNAAKKAEAGDTSKGVAANTNALTWSEIGFDWTQDEDPAAWGNLVIVHTNDDGEVWLENVVPTTLNIAGTADLVDRVTTVTAGELKVSEAGTAKLDGDRIDSETLFFAKVGKEYKIITMSDLADGTYKGVTGTTLEKDYKVNNKTYYVNVVGGLLKIGSADSTAQSGYLFVTDIEGLETKNKPTVTVLVNGAEEEIDVKLDTTGITAPEAYGIYSYVVTTNGYKLTGLQNIDRANLTPVVDSDGEVVELYYGASEPFSTLDWADYDKIGLKVVTDMRVEADDDVYETNVDVSFTTGAAIDEFIIECVEKVNEEYDWTYEYAYRFVADQDGSDSNTKRDMIVVVVEIDMIENAGRED